MKQNFFIIFHRQVNMMKNQKIYHTICFAVLAGILVILIALSLYCGSVRYSPEKITEILSGKSTDNSAISIVKEIRLPRAVASAILGGALAVSGFLLQIFFSNPIAGPFVLGISSGAKLTVALAMIFFFKAGIIPESAEIMLSSFTGSMIATGFILAVSGKVKKSSSLVVSGIMIGYICSAVTDFAVTFADDSNIVNLHNWSMGSFSGIDSEDIKIISAVIFPATALTMMISKQIGAYRLGETYARSIGMNIKVFRIVLILLSSILSATVTAFAGPVSFVGIAVPHLIRGLLKTSKPSLIIPASFLGGASFCVMCDLIARTLFSPSELSIGSVTAVFGAPAVIWIMLKRKKTEV